MQQFHIGDVLTVTTGKLVSPRGIDGAYSILGYMTGDKLYTHQLGRAMDECKPYLLQQHPQLGTIDASAVSAGTWSSWLQDQVAKFGETLPVLAMPESAHKLIEPLDELKEMVGSRAIVIEGVDRDGRA